MRQTTLDELNMKVYKKDPTAAAVVLYEHANLYLDPHNKYNTRIDYYYRIKIFNKEAFDLANITIETAKKKKVTDIKAITYYLSDFGSLNASTLSKDKIFEVDESENWKSHKFTMPNIKEGCVIEYSYSVISPYLGIPDWYFQSDIPKMKSEFDAAILGNYRYNVALTGFYKLDKRESSVKKNCIYIDGLGEGSCIIYSFGINDIPAFKEEDYMLSKKNYISRLSFDLETYTTSKGIIKNYTTSWKEADKKLKKIFFNNQTSKKKFFKKNIPSEILNIKDELNKAKKVYSFIQNHYNWNEKYWNYEDEKVKAAFANKVGTAGEINLSLHNALQAAGINSQLVILSTRENGLPKTLYPVIFDFNYVIVRVKINDNNYYLDATDKFNPFGQVPFRTLNGNGRILNYKKESNWVRVVPKFNTSKKITANLSLNEDGDFEGNLLIKRQGYAAERQRKKLNELGNEGLIDDFEERNPDVEVDEYEVKNEDDLEKSLQEVYKIKLLMDDELSDKIRINPFFFDRLKQNPFKLKERNYPVDFGYKRRSYFTLSLNIPKEYTITNLPKSVSITLPNKSATFIMKAVNKDNVISIYSRILISKSSFTSDEYFSLKELYKEIVKTENSYITIEKK